MLDELYQDIILDHNANPKHYGRLKHLTHTAKGHNPVCGDTIVVDISRDDAGRVTAIGFESNGCAISKAAASIMTEAVAKKGEEDIEKIANNFILMTTGSGELAEFATVDDLQAFSGVRKYPSRIKCANLPWRTLQAALAGKVIASTE